MREGKVTITGIVCGIVTEFPLGIGSHQGPIFPFYTNALVMNNQCQRSR